MEGADKLWKYLALALLACIVDICKAVPEFYASSQVTQNLQNKMISRSMRIPMRSYETKASKIVSWVTEDCDYADGVITTFIGFFTGIVSTILSINEMSAIDQSMLFLIPVIFVYVVISTWLSGQLMFLRERLGRRAISDLTAYMAEHLGLFRQIRQMNTIEDELVIGRHAVNRMFYAKVKQSFLTLANMLVSGSTSEILTILVFVFGAAKVRAGDFSIEELAAFQAYILIVYQSLESLPDLYTSLMYQNGILFFISGLMAEKEEVVKRKRNMDGLEGEFCLTERMSRTFIWMNGEKALAICCRSQCSLRVPCGKISFTGSRGMSRRRKSGLLRARSAQMNLSVIFRAAMNLMLARTDPISPPVRDRRLPL